MASLIDTRHDTSKINNPAVSTDFNKDDFLVHLISELAQILEQVIGMEDAEGFISIVGNQVGIRINDEYRQKLGQDKLSHEQIADVLVDLKRRIGGCFTVTSQTENKIVLNNTRCPFGDLVTGKASLCMMTSNVFGRIASENAGFASVEIEKSIAKGDKHCQVKVAFDLDSSTPTEGARTYFPLKASRSN